MSHIAFDFLADSIFLNSNSLDSNFERETDERLEKELMDYRQYVIKNIEKLREEIAATKSDLSVFSTAQNTPISLLKQTALYLNKYVVADPLFRITESPSQAKEAISQSLGFQSGLNREAILRASKYLKTITPMVAGNFIKVFPVTYYFESPKELQWKLPVNNNNDLLPRELMQFFQEHSIISPMEKIDGGWAILNTDSLQPCRAINVDFLGDRSTSGRFFVLFESKILEVDEETRKVKAVQYLPPDPPSQEVFENWVIQSKNSAAKAYFDEALAEVYLAEKLGARFISENPFKNKLLSHGFEETVQDIKGFTTTQVLNIRLPFLDKIDTEKLMLLREGEAGVFLNFRTELEKQFRELRLLKDDKDLRLKAENIFHELNDVQSQKITTRLQHIQKQMVLNATLSLGGLLGSVTTGGMSLAALAVGLAKGYKDYKDYVQNVKENPAFFLWKTMS